MKQLTNEDFLTLDNELSNSVTQFETTIGKVKLQLDNFDNQIIDNRLKYEPSNEYTKLFRHLNEVCKRFNITDEDLSDLKNDCQ